MKNYGIKEIKEIYFSESTAHLTIHLNCEAYTDNFEIIDINLTIPIYDFINVFDKKMIDIIKEKLINEIKNK